MSPRLTFYGYPQSHYCIAVDRMLAFKGVKARLVRVPYHDKRDLLRATGQDYVPAIVAGRRVVEWREIPRYLETLVPTPTLYPPGREGLAETLANWGQQVLEERVWRTVVSRITRTFPDAVERGVFEEMQTRARGSFAQLDARRAEFVEDLGRHLAMVERMLDGRAWVLDEPSVADFGIFGALSPLFTVGDPVPARFPNVRRWARAVARLGRPSLFG